MGTRADIVGLLLRRFTWRHWRTAPRQSLLLVLILALGVAVFFSIRLANRAAVASFQNFTDLITRQSDLLIQSPAGQLPESVLPELRQALGQSPVEMIPVLESTGARPRAGAQMEIGSRETFQIMGLDLIAVQNLAEIRGAAQRWFGQDTVAEKRGEQFWQSFRDEQGVFISEALARREGLKIGSGWELVINEKIVSLRVAGVIPEQADAPKAPPTLLIMDLPALQKVTGRQGRLDRIEFIVVDGPEASRERTVLRSLLERNAQNRWLVSSPNERRESAATMTSAFRMNLTILSLIALLVGLYLIFQALDGAVVRRREEIGILRSLGVEESVIRRVWLLEATLLGLAGGLLGALLGWGGAQLSVRVVARTVNALYYATSVQSARLEWSELLLALAIAVCTSLLAGWLPARDAARTPPAQILVRHAVAASGPPLWRKEWLGVVLLLLGAVLIYVPPIRLEGGSRFSLAGYIAAFAWVFGGGVLAGWVLRRLAALLHPLGQSSLLIRLATSYLTRPSGRHRLALAGLLCAIAMTAGMAILVASFEQTMQGWINRTFQSDLYISSDGAQSASTQNRISEATWNKLINDPAVQDHNVIQATEILLRGNRTMLVGADLSFAKRHQSLAWLQRPTTEDVFDPQKNDGICFVSESFCERFQVKLNDSLVVPTPAKEQTLRIAGVFADYGNERGSIVVQREAFASWFADELASSVIIQLKTGMKAEDIKAQWSGEFPGLSIFTNAHLRTEVLRIFRQTFSITYALEVIGVAVAVVGLGMTLASILLERRAELTTMRALGLSRAEMAKATAGEGFILSLCGVLSGLLISVALGWLLIYVINKQTFGWTLQFDLPWFQLAVLGLLVVAAGTAVSFGVVRWGAALPADREE